VNRM